MRGIPFPPGTPRGAPQSDAEGQTPHPVRAAHRPGSFWEGPAARTVAGGARGAPARTGGETAHESGGCARILTLLRTAAPPPQGWPLPRRERLLSGGDARAYRLAEYR